MLRLPTLSRDSSISLIIPQMHQAMEWLRDRRRL